MNFLKDISQQVSQSLKNKFDCDVAAADILINHTKPEFEGSYTVVLFPFVKRTKSNPQTLGEAIGEDLVNHTKSIEKFNIVKGFLNLSFTNAFWLRQLERSISGEYREVNVGNGEKVLVEYSSPNTNKPLHLGHIRNILLGWSTANILEKTGYDVIRTQIVNDRGVAICKSMLSWKLFGNGETPESTGVKSDFLVGKYYVEFDKRLKAEYEIWQKSERGQQVLKEKAKSTTTSGDFFKGFKNQYFNDYSELGQQVKSMLLNWEAGDDAVKALWRKMNGWVYDGFDVTYKNLEVGFDQSYYESETYLTGKSMVEAGESAGIFYKKEDGSIWVNLEPEGLDHKILLRSDGTSVYLTQDLGTADIRYSDHHATRMIYVVGDEQNYHFKVLFEIMKKLNKPYADGLYHLSYGMVDLPTGKMKSREGTVVDADVLISEVIEEARSGAEERGDMGGLTTDEHEKVIKDIGLGALKYFILKVNPQKRIVFDPKESVDMHGQTGPYIQNAFVRIKSIFRKSEEALTQSFGEYECHELERELVNQLIQYPTVLSHAAANYDPSLVAHYSYDLAKGFHRFYHDLRILGAETPEAKSFRLNLSNQIANTLESSLNLLGINLPQRM